MNKLARGTAVGLAGFCTFINLYSPQSLLPSLAAEFAVSAAVISATMTAGTLAVALTAPFSGAVADVIGRKRVITASMVALAVPTLMIAMAPDVQALIIWRFIQGLTLPSIFAVIIAYIGDEWPAAEVAGMAGIYTSGASLGGFSGRFVTGVLTDLVGWRLAYAALAVITLAAAAAVAVLLPRERRFVRSESLAASLKQMLLHLRNPQLLATYAVGFGTLFNFIATFTYINFVLAAPPFSFSATMLGTIFLVYLLGAAVTPMTGRFIHRFGRRPFMIGNCAVWVLGILLTLIPSLTAIIAGLSVCAVCGLISQAISTGYVTLTAQEGRSSAVGLYVTIFYIGGSFGAFLAGIAWEKAGWPACVTLVAAMIAIIAAVVALGWKDQPTASAAA
ncbi:MAG: MFS transporter [Xanthobacteraceae bacterium]|nr:MFS transporter [Xanthobacteraceae bacterium]